ncbi:MAG: phosphonate ABC transporter ATP-binding protein [Candidatus Tectimicrobiota bacterium]
MRMSEGGQAASLSNVTLRYGDGRLALEDLSLYFTTGEQAAIIGPSGAGKTSLLHMLACALRPSSGTLTVLGEQPWGQTTRALRALRQRIFLVPQMPPLPPRQRVVHAVLAGRLPYWSTRQALQSLLYPAEAPLAQAALARLRLDDKLYLRCDRLSGGERQRVSLARMLLSEAPLLLLDEPVSALDPVLGLHTLQTVQEEARARGATMVVSLHSVNLARTLFTRLIGIRAGKVFFDLPRAQVTDARLAELYGAEPEDALTEAVPVDLPGVKISRCF